MTYGHLRADCLYTGISSGPNARYRIWENLYLLPNAFQQEESVARFRLFLTTMQLCGSASRHSCLTSAKIQDCSVAFVVLLNIRYQWEGSRFNWVRIHHHTTTILRPFFRDHPGEPVPEENFWTLWCKERFTEADTLTMRLCATPSGLTGAHVHHPPIFFLRAGCPS